MLSKFTLKNFLILSFLFNFITIGLSQNTYDIMGKILTEKQEPIEIGNIILLNPKDSSLIQGDLFLDGQFEIKNLTISSLLLKITALGFEDYYKLIENSEKKSQVNLENIILKTQLIEGVEVIASRAMFEQKEGNLLVNVANTALSNSGTAMDVLRNSPKVILSSSGGISVLGKGTALIYLDGQRITSNQILQNLSSNDIKAIEIIENPSAKYDAEGNAVINILTKNKTLEGFKIGLIQEVGMGKHFRSYFQLNTYYKIKKWLFQTSYGIRPWTRGGREEHFRTFNFEDKLTEIENQNIYSQKALNHDLNFKTAYQISEKSKIGFQYTGVLWHWNKTGNNRNTFNENGETAFKIKTSVKGPFDSKSHTMNAFYENNLDTLGSNISVSGQFSNFNLERSEDIHLNFETTEIQEFNRRSFNQNEINIYSIQTDYQKIFKNGASWESGLKSAQISNESLLNFENENENEDGSFSVVPSFSNNFEYNENIFAAYSQFTWKGKSTKTNLGLRSEWTQSDGKTVADAATPISRNYLDFFPSFSFSKNFENGVTAGFNYNYRIQRPQFQDLNPFVLYADSLVTLQGNPNLLPQYSHAFSGNLNYKKWTFNLNYTYTKDRISGIFEMNNPESGVITFTKDNIKSMELTGLSASYPIQKDWYSGYFTIGGQYEKHRVQDIENLQINSRSSYYISAFQTIQLPADFKFEAMFNYVSPQVDGIYLDNPIWYLNLSLSRKFFDNHLTARIWANDIFDKYKFTGRGNFNGNTFNYLSEGDMHFVKLVLSWDFGKLGIGNLKEKKISKEELNRINRG